MALAPGESIGAGYVFAPASNVIEQRNGTAAQAYRLYNTYTDSSNYERDAWQYSGNVIEHRSQAAGTGTVRNILITADAQVPNNTAGATITVTSGAGLGSGNGGPLTLAAGQAGVTGAGGAANLTSGAGGGTSGASGGITLQIGSVTSGNAGALQILGAAGAGGNNVGTTVIITAGNSAGNGAGGSIALTPGTSATGAAGQVTITGTSAALLVVGRQGATNPVLTVNAATAVVVTGISITGAAAAGGVNIAATSSGANENLTINALGSGTITLNGTATGAIVSSQVHTFIDGTAATPSIRRAATVQGFAFGLNVTRISNNGIDGGSFTGSTANDQAFTLPSLGTFGWATTENSNVTPVNYFQRTGTNQVRFYGNLAVTGVDEAGNVRNLFVLNPPGYTAVIAEYTDVLYNAHTMTITGNYATQRFVQWASPTVTSVGAQTITTAIAMQVNGPLPAGAAVCTNSVALDIPTYATNGTTASALRVAAPTGAATNWAINVPAGASTFQAVTINGLLSSSNIQVAANAGIIAASGVIAFSVVSTALTIGSAGSVVVPYADMGNAASDAARDTLVGNINGAVAIDSVGVAGTYKFWVRANNAWKSVTVA